MNKSRVMPLLAGDSDGEKPALVHREKQGVTAKIRQRQNILKK
jgi:hypothetical protein